MSASVETTAEPGRDASPQPAIEGFPLSLQQRHLWALQRDAGVWPPVRCAVAIDGPLDPALLRAALARLVEDHEILRTEVRGVPGLAFPLQVIGDGGVRWVADEDLSGLARDAAVDAALEAARPEVDAGAGAGPYAALLRLAADRGLLILLLPALCADRPSLDFLIADLARAYAALRDGDEPPAPQIQYADYADWQAELAESEDVVAERKYWRELSIDELRDPHLPWLRQPAAAFDPRTVPVPEAGSAPADRGFLLACWAALLGRLGDRRRVVIGVASDGRNYDELEAAVGPYVKTLPVRCEPDPALPFERFLERVRRGLEEAEAHQDSFSWETLEAPDETAPAFPAFAFETHDHGDRVAAGEVTFALARETVLGERFAVQLRRVVRRGGPALELRYDAGRMAASDARRLAEGLGALVRDARARPGAALGDLEIVSEAERFRLLVEANRTTCALPGAGLLHRPFERQAARTPERIALRSAATHLSYGALDARAETAAARLRDLGVGPETPVAILLERGPAMVIGLLAILKTGGFFVPLDPDHPPERLAGMLDEIDPAAIVVARRLPAAVRRPGAAVVALDDLAPAAGTGGDRGRAPRPDPEQLAYVLYTSGSTGRPKGVMMTHRGISNRLRWMQREFPLAAGDRVLQKTPYVFDASIWEIFSPLSEGAELVLARPDGHRDMAYLARETVAAGVTVLQMVPSLLRLLVAEPELANARALRRFFCGGEALTTDLAERLLALLDLELVNLYGPTEAAIDAAFHRYRRGRGGHGVPIGGPIANVGIYLLDRRQRPVPRGIEGEILIAGAGLARGYLGRPGHTAERFVPDATSGAAGERLYRTGDLARHLPDGAIEYRGRIDRQVKIRGVRIELAEIETCLCRHPAVAEAVLAVAPAETGAEDGDGHRDDRLVAYVALRNGDADSAGAEIRAFLYDQLPEAMVPAALVALRELPRTASGKIDRRALPAPEAAIDAGRRVAPRDEIEGILAALWSEVLGVPEVGIDDNFFDLGGHSLSATQLMSRLRRGLEVDLPVHKLFDAPTVSGLAREVASAVRGEAGPPPVEPAPRREEMPLSFSQQRLWFFERLHRGTAVFNIPAAFRLAGELDVDALEQAVGRVVERHEILRTVYPDRRGLPVQVITEEMRVRLPVVDLSALLAADLETEERRLLRDAASRPLDLERGPVLRWLLVRRGERDHTAAFIIHHIASDAWSSGILVREVVELYRAHVRGRPPVLPELALQYADYAAWQQRWLASDGMARQLAYWREQLRDAPRLLRLPADRPRPEVFSYRGETLPVALAPELTAPLETLGRDHGATLFMTLMAAFQTLLGHLSGQDDVVVGTDVANRNRLETEGLIGFFINQLALRARLGGDPEFTDLLAQVRATTLAAYAHQDLPFEQLVDALKLSRELSHAPVFQAKLFLENTPQATLELPGLRLTPLELETDVAKLDLVLALWQTPAGLRGWINYSTDLFDRPRIERLIKRYETLLEAIVKTPRARLSALGETLGSAERKEREMEKREFRKHSFSKFKKAAPQMVTLSQESVVEKTTLAPGQSLPLVIQPTGPDVVLADWAAAHKDEIEKDLQRHGAILFRGFDIDTPERLEAFAGTLCSDLFNENGEHPRESVTGNVYTPVFYPPDQQLLWHNENSFNYRWPRKIFFACAQPPEEGGETPIVDSRRVYDEIDADVRQRFEDKGVMYQRNYEAGLGLDWQTVFQVSDRAEAEEKCRADRVDVDWRDGERMRTRAVRPAVVRHPATGEMTWFNQAQHWHVSCLDPETRRSMRKLYDDEDLPRHCYLGDGSAIEDGEMHAILDVYGRLEVAFPWQRGDVLMVDNLLVAHGRNPFKGARKILVAMGQMTDFGDV